MWLWQNFENCMQLAKFHHKRQNEEFGWLSKRLGRLVFVESRTFTCEGERNDNMLHYEQMVGNVFEGKKSSCCAELM